MNYLLYILVAAMPFIITDRLWDYSNLPKTLFIQNGVILLAVIFFWTRKLKDITLSRTLIAYMLFLAWAGLSILWAVNKYEAVMILSHWTIVGLFLFLVQNMNINRVVISAIIFLTAWIVAVIGLGQFFFHITWIMQSSGPAATFANKNLAIAYILMTMPLCVACMVFVYWHKLWILFTILSCAMATILGYIYVANRKTALVVILIIGTYYLFKYLRRVAGRPYALLAIVVAGLFLAGYLYVKPYTFFGHGRIPIYQNTAKIIKQNPIIGVGVGNFKIQYDKYADLTMNTNETHNDYIQMLCEVGIIGSYLMFLVIVYTYRAAFRKCDLYSTALKAGLWAFLLVAAFNFPMQKAADPFLCALYLGILKV